MMPAMLRRLVLGLAVVGQRRRQIDRLLRRGRRLQHLRLRVDARLGVLVVGDLILGRRRVEREPSDALEVDLDPGVHVVAGRGEDGFALLLGRPGSSP